MFSDIFIIFRLLYNILNSNYPQRKIEWSRTKMDKKQQIVYQRIKYTGFDCDNVVNGYTGKSLLFPYDIKTTRKVAYEYKIL